MRAVREVSLAPKSGTLLSGQMIIFLWVTLPSSSFGHSSQQTFPPDSSVLYSKAEKLRSGPWGRGGLFCNKANFHNNYWRYLICRHFPFDCRARDRKSFASGNEPTERKWVNRAAELMETCSLRCATIDLHEHKWTAGSSDTCTSTVSKTNASQVENQFNNIQWK